MANHVYNEIKIIAETPATATCILNLLSNEDGKFTDIDKVLRYCGKTLTRDNILKWAWNVGTKWVQLDVKQDEDDLAVLRLVGYSAWAPPAGLLRLLSRKFRCQVSCLYVDSLDPFAGYVRYSKGWRKESIHHTEPEDASKFLIEHLGINKAMECWGLDPNDNECKEQFGSGEPPLVMVI